MIKRNLKIHLTSEIPKTNSQIVIFLTSQLKFQYFECGMPSIIIESIGNIDKLLQNFCIYILKALMIKK